MISFYDKIGPTKRVRDLSAADGIDYSSPWLRRRRYPIIDQAGNSPLRATLSGRLQRLPSLTYSVPLPYLKISLTPIGSCPEFPGGLIPYARVRFWLP